MNSNHRFFFLLFQEGKCRDNRQGSAFIVNWKTLKPTPISKHHSLFISLVFNYNGYHKSDKTKGKAESIEFVS